MVRAHARVYLAFFLAASGGARTPRRASQAFATGARAARRLLQAAVIIPLAVKLISVSKIIAGSKLTKNFDDSASGGRFGQFAQRRSQPPSYACKAQHDFFHDLFSSLHATPLELIMGIR